MMPPELDLLDRISRTDRAQAMVEYVYDEPHLAYEALMQRYWRVRGDHHLVEPAYQALCEAWLVPGMTEETAQKLSTLKRARRSAYYLVRSAEFRKLIDVDYPPEIA